MKHLLTVLTVMASWTAQAQQPGSCLKLSKIRIADHLLHQYGETRAELTFKARNCYVIEGHPVVVTFEDKPSLQAVVTGTGFSNFDQESVGTATVKAREMSLAVTLKALPSLPVGEHSLHAMVTYQRLDNSGAVKSETVAIQIPFKVAPPKAYSPVKEHSGFLKGLQITGEIVAGIPLLLVMMVWCPISGNCPTC